MSKKEEFFKERFKQALDSTYKVISEELHNLSEKENPKNIQTYTQMKIQKARYMDSDSKMNQQRDPVLQRLENQIDLMLTRFRQQSQWSSEHG